MEKQNNIGPPPDFPNKIVSTIAAILLPPQLTISVKK